MPKYRLFFWDTLLYTLKRIHEIHVHCAKTSSIIFKHKTILGKGNSQRARAEKAAGRVTSARRSVHQAPRYKGFSISNSLVTLFVTSFKRSKRKLTSFVIKQSNQKVALDMEIAVFQRLLETEEDRLGIEGRSGHWSCLVKKWTFWNLKFGMNVKGKLNRFVYFK